MNTPSSTFLSRNNITILCLCFLFGMSACKKNSDSAQTDVVISAITPAFGPYSTIDTITGSGFNSNAADNAVKFNGVTAVVQKASATQLIVAVPKAAGTGTVTVQSGTQLGTGPVFTYIYTGTVTTLAGSTAGFADGNGMAAQFNQPIGIATDLQGNIYVADSNNRIRKITPAGIVSTLAGSGIAGFADGNGNTAQFNVTTGVATDSQGNIYVADVNNERIRKVTPAGVVSTLAGSGVAGFADGDSNIAQFNGPLGVGTDAQGNVYVGDITNDRIRKVTPAGVVSTLAGNGTIGFADGSGSTAEFWFPWGLVSDVQGNIYASDYQNQCIRKITPAGVVSTLAGNGDGSDIPGFADGSGTTVLFNFPIGVAIDPQGDIYVADSYNNRIRMITPAGIVGTLAGNATAGFADGVGTSAEFNSPYGVAADAHGNIYVADTYNNRIRMITVQ